MDYDKLNTIPELEAALDEIEKQETEAIRTEAVIAAGMDEIRRREIELTKAKLDQSIELRKAKTICKEITNARFAIMRKLKQAYR